ncbi:MAG: hypothetical protein ABI867_01510 [Kofleriaceae bacterium]
MDSSERIRRGDGELVAREAVEPVISVDLDAGVARTRVTIPPPPPTRLRPPTSWLRAR